MICALTVRKLRPGAFDQFREAFMAPLSTGQMPSGWRHFNMIRNSEDPNEVICFGFFDGTPETLRADATQSSYEQQQTAIAPFVESVGPSGVYEVIEDRAP